MEIVKVQGVSCEIVDKLSKIISSPLMYPEFPVIPHGIFSSNGKLLGEYSLYKKGTAYYVLNDGKGEYKQGMDVLDVSKILFEFSQFELESPHIGETLRNKLSNIIETSEIRIFEEALETIIFKKLYNSLPGYFGNTLSNKLYELSALTGDTDFSYLVGISLIPLGGHFIVLDTEIDFSRQELERIKKAVFR